MAAVKAVEEEAVRLAVIAHIRHAETHYDELLARGYDRWDAGAEVEGVVRYVLTGWQSSGTKTT